MRPKKPIIIVIIIPIEFCGVFFSIDLFSLKEKATTLSPSTNRNYFDFKIGC